MEISKHYVDAFSEYLLYLSEKYGSDWRDSMLTEYELMTINGFRFMSLNRQDIIRNAPPTIEGNDNA